MGFSLFMNVMVIMNVMVKLIKALSKCIFFIGTVSQVSDLAYSPFVSVQFALFVNFYTFSVNFYTFSCRFALENLGENSVPNHM